MERMRAAALLVGVLVAGAVRAETARPLALLDAATLQVQIGDQRRVLRLVGVVPPQDRTCTAAALAALTSESAGDFVLAADPSHGEAEGALMRYATVGSRDFGAEVIRRGLALAAGGSYERAEVYRAAETEARRAQRGLWSLACGSTLAQALAARDAPKAPPPLPRGNVAAAKEAIAELQARNDRGENRVEDMPIIDVTALRPSPTAAEERSEARDEDKREPGRAQQLSGPRMRRLDGGRVRVEGRYWNSGETKVAGRVRVELRDNGSLVDSGSVRLVIEPDGEASYSIELSPGAGTSNLVATAEWEPGR